MIFGFYFIQKTALISFPLLQRLRSKNLNHITCQHFRSYLIYADDSKDGENDLSRSFSKDGKHYWSILH